MTKEELVKEAKDSWWNDNNCSGALPTEQIYECGYIAGAEPREKRIAELTEQNTSLLASVENLNKSVQALGERCLQLQKDKGELTDRVRELEAEVKEWKDKANLWCKTANLKDHNIMINKELEKENAELKARVSEQSERIRELTQELDDEINRLG